VGGGRRAAEKSGRMDNILSTVADCSTIVSMRIGDAPKEILRNQGIFFITTYDRIEDAVKSAVKQFQINR